MVTGKIYKELNTIGQRALVTAHKLKRTALMKKELNKLSQNMLQIRQKLTRLDKTPTRQRQIDELTKMTKTKKIGGNEKIKQNSLITNKVLPRESSFGMYSPPTDRTNNPALTKRSNIKTVENIQRPDSKDITETKSLNNLNVGEVLYDSDRESLRHDYSTLDKNLDILASQYLINTDKSEVYSINNKALNATNTTPMSNNEQNLKFNSITTTPYTSNKRTKISQKQDKLDLTNEMKLSGHPTVDFDQTKYLLHNNKSNIVKESNHKIEDQKTEQRDKLEFKNKTQNDKPFRRRNGNRQHSNTFALKNITNTSFQHKQPKSGNDLKLKLPYSSEKTDQLLEMLKSSKETNKAMGSFQNITTYSKRDRQIDHPKARLTFHSNEQKQTLKKARQKSTKSNHRHDIGHKKATKSEDKYADHDHQVLGKASTSNKTRHQDTNTTRSTKTTKTNVENRDRHNMHKTSQVSRRPDETSDMNNELHASTYIKNITGETEQHPNEKHTAKTYSTNITLDVQPQHTDIKIYSLKQLEDDKHIHKPIHDLHKQVNTNRQVNINQTPERLKQTTARKNLHKDKYKLVATQQQKMNVTGNMDSQYLEPKHKNKTIVDRQNKFKTKMQLKNDANMEILQSAYQNDTVTISNNHEVSKYEHTNNEDKNKQIHSQIKIINQHLKSITKIDKYKKLNRTSTTEHKAEHKYTLVNQTINIRKSNKAGTKEIEHISNNEIQRFKGRKTLDVKMTNQKIQLNHNKNHYTEQNKQHKNKDNITEDKNKLNDNKHNVGHLATPILDLLKVFYNTRSDKNIFKHSTHTLKITKNNNTNNNTNKQSTKYKQETSTSKHQTKKTNKNIQPTTDEYTLYIPTIENQNNVKPYYKNKKQNHKIKTISLKKDKANISFSKISINVTEKHKETKNKMTVHHKQKEFMQHNSIQKLSENHSVFLLNKSLTQSPLILSNSLVDTHEPQNKSIVLVQSVKKQLNSKRHDLVQPKYTNNKHITSTTMNKARGLHKKGKTLAIKQSRHNSKNNSKHTDTDIKAYKLNRKIDNKSNSDLYQIHLKAAQNFHEIAETPLCQHGKIQLSTTLIGGPLAGETLLIKNIPAPSSCVRLCCANPSCNVAMVIQNICYVIKCSGSFLCKSATLSDQNSISLTFIYRNFTINNMTTTDSVNREHSFKSSNILRNKVNETIVTNSTKQIKSTERKKTVKRNTYKTEKTEDKISITKNNYSTNYIVIRTNSTDYKIGKINHGKNTVHVPHNFLLKLLEELNSAKKYLSSARRTTVSPENLLKNTSTNEKKLFSDLRYAKEYLNVSDNVNRFTLKQVPKDLLQNITFNKETLISELADANTFLPESQNKSKLNITQTSHFKSKEYKNQIPAPTYFLKKLHKHSDWDKVLDFLQNYVKVKHIPFNFKTVRGVKRNSLIENHPKAGRWNESNTNFNKLKELKAEFEISLKNNARKKYDSNTSITRTYDTKNNNTNIVSDKNNHLDKTIMTERQRTDLVVHKTKKDSTRIKLKTEPGEITTVTYHEKVKTTINGESPHNQPRAIQHHQNKNLIHQTETKSDKTESIFNQTRLILNQTKNHPKQTQQRKYKTGASKKSSSKSDFYNKSLNTSFSMIINKTANIPTTNDTESTKLRTSFKAIKTARRVSPNGIPTSVNKMNISADEKLKPTETKVTYKTNYSIVDNSTYLDDTYKLSEKHDLVIRSNKKLYEENNVAPNITDAGIAIKKAVRSIKPGFVINVSFQPYHPLVSPIPGHFGNEKIKPNVLMSKAALKKTLKSKIKQGIHATDSQLIHYGPLILPMHTDNKQTGELKHLKNITFGDKSQQTNITVTWTKPTTEANTDGTINTNLTNLPSGKLINMTGAKYDTLNNTKSTGKISSNVKTYNKETLLITGQFSLTTIHNRTNITQTAKPTTGVTLTILQTESIIPHAKSITVKPTSSNMQVTSPTTEVTSTTTQSRTPTAHITSTTTQPKLTLTQLTSSNTQATLPTRKATSKSEQTTSPTSNAISTATRTTLPVIQTIPITTQATSPTLPRNDATPSTTRTISKTTNFAPNLLGKTTPSAAVSSEFITISADRAILNNQSVDARITFRSTIPTVTSTNTMSISTATVGTTSITEPTNTNDKDNNIMTTKATLTKTLNYANLLPLNTNFSAKWDATTSFMSSITNNNTFSVNNRSDKKLNYLSHRYVVDSFNTIFSNVTVNSIKNDTLTSMTPFMRPLSKPQNTRPTIKSASSNKNIGSDMKTNRPNVKELDNLTMNLTKTKQHNNMETTLLNTNLTYSTKTKQFKDKSETELPKPTFHNEVMITATRSLKMNSTLAATTVSSILLNRTYVNTKTTAPVLYSETILPNRIPHLTFDKNTIKTTNITSMHMVTNSSNVTSPATKNETSPFDSNILLPIKPTIMMSNLPTMTHDEVSSTKSKLPSMFSVEKTPVFYHLNKTHGLTILNTTTTTDPLVTAFNNTDKTNTLTAIERNTKYDILNITINNTNKEPNLAPHYATSKDLLGHYSGNSKPILHPISSENLLEKMFDITGNKDNFTKLNISHDNSNLGNSSVIRSLVNHTIRKSSWTSNSTVVTNSNTETFNITGINDLTKTSNNITSNINKNSDITLQVSPDRRENAAKRNVGYAKTNSNMLKDLGNDILFLKLVREGEEKENHLNSSKVTDTIHFLNLVREGLEQNKIYKTTPTKKTLHIDSSTRFQPHHPPVVKTFSRWNFTHAFISNLLNGSNLHNTVPSFKSQVKVNIIKDHFDNNTTKTDNNDTAVDDDLIDPTSRPTTATKNIPEEIIPAFDNKSSILAPNPYDKKKVYTAADTVLSKWNISSKFIQSLLGDYDKLNSSQKTRGSLPQSITLLKHFENLKFNVSSLKENNTPSNHVKKHDETTNQIQHTYLGNNEIENTNDKLANSKFDNKIIPNTTLLVQNQTGQNHYKITVESLNKFVPNKNDFPTFRRKFLQSMLSFYRATSALKKPGVKLPTFLAQKVEETQPLLNFLLSNKNKTNYDKTIYDGQHPANLTSYGDNDNELGNNSKTNLDTMHLLDIMYHKHLPPNRIITQSRDKEVENDMKHTEDSMQNNVIENIKTQNNNVTESIKTQSQTLKQNQSKELHLDIIKDNDTLFRNKTLVLTKMTPNENIIWDKYDTKYTSNTQNSHTTENRWPTAEYLELKQLTDITNKHKTNHHNSMLNNVKLNENKQSNTMRPNIKTLQDKNMKENFDSEILARVKLEGNHTVENVLKHPEQADLVNIGNLRLLLGLLQNNAKNLSQNIQADNTNNNFSSKFTGIKEMLTPKTFPGKSSTKINLNIKDNDFSLEDFLLLKNSSTNLDVKSIKKLKSSPGPPYNGDKNNKLEDSNKASLNYNFNEDHSPDKNTKHHNEIHTATSILTQSNTPTVLNKPYIFNKTELVTNIFVPNNKSNELSAFGDLSDVVTYFDTTVPQNILHPGSKDKENHKETDPTRLHKTQHEEIKLHPEIRQYERQTKQKQNHYHHQKSNLHPHNKHNHHHHVHHHNEPPKPEREIRKLIKTEKQGPLVIYLNKTESTKPRLNNASKILDLTSKDLHKNQETTNSNNLQKTNQTVKQNNSTVAIKHKHKSNDEQHELGRKQIHKKQHTLRQQTKDPNKTIKLTKHNSPRKQFNSNTTGRTEGDEIPTYFDYTVPPNTTFIVTDKETKENRLNKKQSASLHYINNTSKEKTETDDIVTYFDHTVPTNTTLVMLDTDMKPNQYNKNQSSALDHINNTLTEETGNDEIVTYFDHNVPTKSTFLITDKEMNETQRNQEHGQQRHHLRTETKLRQQGQEQYLVTNGESLASENRTATLNKTKDLNNATDNSETINPQDMYHDQLESETKHLNPDLNKDQNDLKAGELVLNTTHNNKNKTFSSKPKQQRKNYEKGKKQHRLEQAEKNDKSINQLRHQNDTKRQSTTRHAQNATEKQSNTNTATYITLKNQMFQNDITNLNNNTIPNTDSTPPKELYQNHVEMPVKHLNPDLNTNDTEEILMTLDSFDNNKFNLFSLDKTNQKHNKSNIKTTESTTQDQNFLKGNFNQIWKFNQNQTLKQKINENQTIPNTELMSKTEKNNLHQSTLKTTTLNIKHQMTKTNDTVDINYPEHSLSKNEYMIFNKSSDLLNLDNSSLANFTDSGGLLYLTNSTLTNNIKFPENLIYAYNNSFLTTSATSGNVPKFVDLDKSLESKNFTNLTDYSESNHLTLPSNNSTSNLSIKFTTTKFTNLNDLSHSKNTIKLTTELPTENGTDLNNIKGLSEFKPVKFVENIQNYDKKILGNSINFSNDGGNEPVKVEEFMAGNNTHPFVPVFIQNNKSLQTSDNEDNVTDFDHTLPTNTTFVTTDNDIKQYQRNQSHDQQQQDVKAEELHQTQQQLQEQKLQQLEKNRQQQQFDSSLYGVSYFNKPEEDKNRLLNKISPFHHSISKEFNKDQYLQELLHLPYAEVSPQYKEGVDTAAPGYVGPLSPEEKPFQLEDTNKKPTGRLTENKKQGEYQQSMDLSQNKTGQNYEAMDFSEPNDITGEDVDKNQEYQIMHHNKGINSDSQDNKMSFADKLNMKIIYDGVHNTEYKNQEEKSHYKSKEFGHKGDLYEELAMKYESPKWKNQTHPIEINYFPHKNLENRGKHFEDPSLDHFQDIEFNYKNDHDKSLNYPNQHENSNINGNKDWNHNQVNYDDQGSGKSDKYVSKIPENYISGQKFKNDKDHDFRYSSKQKFAHEDMNEDNSKKQKETRHPESSQTKEKLQDWNGGNEISHGEGSGHSDNELPKTLGKLAKSNKFKFYEGSDENHDHAPTSSDSHQFKDDSRYEHNNHYYITAHKNPFIFSDEYLKDSKNIEKMIDINDYLKSDSANSKKKEKNEYDNNLNETRDHEEIEKQNYEEDIAKNARIMEDQVDLIKSKENYNNTDTSYDVDETGNNNGRGTDNDLEKGYKNKNKDSNNNQEENYNDVNKNSNYPNETTEMKMFRDDYSNYSSRDYDHHKLSFPFRTEHDNGSNEYLKQMNEIQKDDHNYLKGNELLEEKYLNDHTNLEQSMEYNLDRGQHLGSSHKSQEIEDKSFNSYETSNELKKNPWNNEKNSQKSYRNHELQELRSKDLENFDQSHEKQEAVEEDFKNTYKSHTKETKEENGKQETLGLLRNTFYHDNQTNQNKNLVEDLNTDKENEDNQQEDQHENHAQSHTKDYSSDKEHQAYEHIVLHGTEEGEIEKNAQKNLNKQKGTDIDENQDDQLNINFHEGNRFLKDERLDIYSKSRKQKQTGNLEDTNAINSKENEDQEASGNEENLNVLKNNHKFIAFALDKNSWKDSQNVEKIHKNEEYNDKDAKEIQLPKRENDRISETEKSVSHNPSEKESQNRDKDNYKNDTAKPSSHDYSTDAIIEHLLKLHKIELINPNKYNESKPAIKTNINQSPKSKKLNLKHSKLKKNLQALKEVIKLLEHAEVINIKNNIRSKLKEEEAKLKMEVAKAVRDDGIKFNLPPYWIHQIDVDDARVIEKPKQTGDLPNQFGEAESLNDIPSEASSGTGQSDLIPDRENNPINPFNEKQIDRIVDMIIEQSQHHSQPKQIQDIRKSLALVNRKNSDKSNMNKLPNKPSMLTFISPEISAKFSKEELKSSKISDEDKAYPHSEKKLKVKVYPDSETKPVVKFDTNFFESLKRKAKFTNEHDTDSNTNLYREKIIPTIFWKKVAHMSPKAISTVPTKTVVTSFTELTTKPKSENTTTLTTPRQQVTTKGKIPINSINFIELLPTFFKVKTTPKSDSISMPVTTTFNPSATKFVNHFRSSSRVQQKIVTPKHDTRFTNLFTKTTKKPQTYGIGLGKGAVNMLEVKYLNNENKPTTSSLSLVIGETTKSTNILNLPEQTHGAGSSKSAIKILELAPPLRKTFFEKTTTAEPKLYSKTTTTVKPKGKTTTIYLPTTTVRMTEKPVTQRTAVLKFYGHEILPENEGNKKSQTVAKNSTLMKNILGEGKALIKIFEEKFLPKTSQSSTQQNTGENLKSKKLVEEGKALIKFFEKKYLTNNETTTNDKTKSLTTTTTPSPRTVISNGATNNKLHKESTTIIILKEKDNQHSTERKFGSPLPTHVTPILRNHFHDNYVEILRKLVANSIQPTLRVEPISSGDKFPGKKSEQKDTHKFLAQFENRKPPESQFNENVIPSLRNKFRENDATTFEKKFKEIRLPNENNTANFINKFKQFSNPSYENKFRLTSGNQEKVTEHYQDKISAPLINEGNMGNKDKEFEKANKKVSELDKTIAAKEKELASLLKQVHSEKLTVDAFFKPRVPPPRDIAAIIRLAKEKAREHKNKHSSGSDVSSLSSPIADYNSHIELNDNSLVNSKPETRDGEFNGIAERTAHGSDANGNTPPVWMNDDENAENAEKKSMDTHSKPSKYTQVNKNKEYDFAKELKEHGYSFPTDINSNNIYDPSKGTEYTNMNGVKKDVLPQKPDEEVSSLNCHVESASFNRTLRGGLRSGIFHTALGADNMGDCVLKCCDLKKCNIALFYRKFCYLVECFNKTACDTVPVDSDKTDHAPIIVTVRGLGTGERKTEQSNQISKEIDKVIIKLWNFHNSVKKNIDNKNKINKIVFEPTLNKQNPESQHDTLSPSTFEHLPNDYIETSEQEKAITTTPRPTEKVEVQKVNVEKVKMEVEELLKRIKELRAQKLEAERDPSLLSTLHYEIKEKPNPVDTKPSLKQTLPETHPSPTKKTTTVTSAIPSTATSTSSTKLSTTRTPTIPSTTTTKTTSTKLTTTLKLTSTETVPPIVEMAYKIIEHYQNHEGVNKSKTGKVLLPTVNDPNTNLTKTKLEPTNITIENNESNKTFHDIDESNELLHKGLQTYKGPKLIENRVLTNLQKSHRISEMTKPSDETEYELGFVYKNGHIETVVKKKIVNVNTTKATKKSEEIIQLPRPKKLTLTDYSNNLPFHSTLDQTDYARVYSRTAELQRLLREQLSELAHGEVTGSIKGYENKSPIKISEITNSREMFDEIVSNITDLLVKTKQPVESLIPKVRDLVHKLNLNNSGEEVANKLTKAVNVSLKSTHTGETRQSFPQPGNQTNSMIKVAAQAEHVASDTLSMITCLATEVKNSYTLKGGTESGNFQYRGVTETFDECIEYCCRDEHCDMSVGINERCYTVTCSNLDLCELVPAEENNDFNILIADVRKSPPKDVNNNSPSQLIKNPDVISFCKHSEVMSDVTLKGSFESGIFTSHGRVKSVDECIQYCCNSLHCDLSFLITDTCYTVYCFDKELCDTVPAYHANILRPRIIYLRSRHLISYSLKKPIDTVRLTNKLHAENDLLNISSSSSLENIFALSQANGPVIYRNHPIFDDNKNKILEIQDSKILSTTTSTPSSTVTETTTTTATTTTSTTTPATTQTTTSLATTGSTTTSPPPTTTTTSTPTTSTATSTTTSTTTETTPTTATMLTPTIPFSQVFMNLKYLTDRNRNPILDLKDLTDGNKNNPITRTPKENGDLPKNPLEVLEHLNRLNVKVPRKQKKRCKPYQVFQDKTLYGGSNAGIFTHQKDIKTFDECIERCCDVETCDIALMMESLCFLVKCSSRESCDVTDMQSTKYQPKIAYIRIALIDAGMLIFYICLVLILLTNLFVL